ncbi:hypothetical protein [Paenimyroides baculatum]|uniref:Uncharacterized protein n=1 Tax=Paenimyroides baculatum TaxID=2608000 RepID=A0A5M6CFD6_9FLAO|nr:hypothetical protein [Paenimyroides baculatum]KAA5533918.1 hypothetical protein F0460_11330 [Paenimyroides baculatum]
MRQLNSIELKEKFEDYSSDIRYCDVDQLTIKVNQFIFFLRDQPISKRILERIENDFKSLRSNLTVDQFQRNGKYYRDLLEQLYSRELQGAFGYFYIIEKFEINPKYRTHYLDDVGKWYGEKDYNEENDRFKSYFFIPFIELFEWFLRESETINPNDYFSEETQQNIIARIDVLEENLSLKLNIGNQIVFEEVEEVKDLITFLNKKNWFEVIKGKFVDLALAEVISKEVANTIVESITGNKIDLFR